MVPREYTVDLGLQTRVLRYTRRERVELERRFSMGLLKLLREQVLPMDDEGKPTFAGMLEPQYAVVFYGVRHIGPQITEEKVAKWLDDVQSGESNSGKFFAVLNTCLLAIMASGVLGFTYEEPPAEEEKPADQGKAQDLPSPS